MNDARRPPPAGLALPALGYLALEAWWLWPLTGAPSALRFALVALLVVGVLFENKAAVPLWMLYNLFGALVFASNSFAAAKDSGVDSAILAALAVAALINMAYLFFVYEPPQSKTREIA
ncbi:MAG: hypothetical protein IT473_07540 [Lysobacter sp.]|nr:hypothetical protein [Lysobacter sp.]